MKLGKSTRYVLMSIATLVLSCGIARAQVEEESTVFYTVGHQDDWQLFMNPNAFYDVRVAQAKVVFIYLTAGDAGLGTDPASPRREPYYLARERAAEHATRFVATPPSWYPGEPEVRTVTINGHRLLRKIYGVRADRIGITTRTVSYFFRLPDGFPDGNGHRGEGPSLEQLWRDGRSITDIVGDSTYESWDDLVLTLRAIVEREARGSTNVWANVPYPNAKSGDGALPDQDHSDHIYSGRAMIEAVNYYPCINKAVFLGYQSSHLPANLTQQQTIWEAATFGATVSGRMERVGAYNTFNDSHIGYLGRNYFGRVDGDGLPCRL